jgi:hypothetical protein
LDFASAASNRDEYRLELPVPIAMICRRVADERLMGGLTAFKLSVVLFDAVLHSCDAVSISPEQNDVLARFHESYRYS